MPEPVYPAAPKTRRGRFRNLPNPQFRSGGGGRFGAFVRWVTTRKPSRWVPVPVEPSCPQRWVTDGDMVVTWVGHATLLVQADGINLLTDPNWSRTVGPVGFTGPRRYAPTGVRFTDLPDIDVVLISHDHYDHLDRPTVLRLWEVHRPRFVVPLGVAPWMRRAGIGDVEELDWWAETDGAAAVRVRATPSQHFSGRGLFDRNRTLWCSFVVSFPSGRFFFAGDTGYAPLFREIGERCGPMRLAAIPIGAYAPRWFMRAVHADPHEAVRIHRDVRAAVSVGIHHGTFRLTDESQGEPPTLLAQAAAEAGLGAGDFRALAVGESLSVEIVESSNRRECRLLGASVGIPSRVRPAGSP